MREKQIGAAIIRIQLANRGKMDMGKCGLYDRCIDVMHNIPKLSNMCRCRVMSECVGS